MGQNFLWKFCPDGFRRRQIANAAEFPHTPFRSVCKNKTAAGGGPFLYFFKNKEI